MITKNRKFGDDGEDLAAEHLRTKGYRILGRNIRVGRMGELDLVVERGGKIIFVEVKTRQTSEYGPPEEAMTPGKRQRFLRAINGFLNSRRLTDTPYRADVIAIDWSNGAPQIRHHESVALEDDI